MTGSVLLAGRRVRESYLWLTAAVLTLIPVPVAGVASVFWILPVVGITTAVAMVWSAWALRRRPTRSLHRRLWTAWLWWLIGGALIWAAVVASSTPWFLASAPVASRYAVGGLLAAAGWVVSALVAHRIAVMLFRAPRDDQSGDQQRSE
jgi:hypothetical protein